MEGPAIRYLQRDQIDAGRWNNCVNTSGNSLIYARADYLDIMTDNWNGLVVGDYDAVMPLPWRKKRGVAYYYHPAFIQQLGIFGHLDKEQYAAVYQTIFKKIRYGDLLLNYNNAGLGKMMAATSCINLILDLSSDYSSLSSGYKTDLRNNIRKASKYDLHYMADPDIPNAIMMFENNYGERISAIQKKDFFRFLHLCETFQKMDMAFVRKVINPEGIILSVALLLKDEYRIYNMMNTTIEEGRAVSANHFLMDNIVREFAGNKLILDLEGSDLPGVKHFYQQFGAREQSYFRSSRLPFLLKMLRKRR